MNKRTTTGMKGSRANVLEPLRVSAKLLFFIAALFFASSCEKIEDLLPDEDEMDENVKLPGIFTMSNEKEGNDVIYFQRKHDGTLRLGGKFSTGGKGTGKSIGGSQHPIELTKDNKFLLVVNAGSDELSAFKVNKGGLELTDVVHSGGQTPVSVTIRKDGLVYVLNKNNGYGGLAAFWLSEHGALVPIPGSEQQLSDDPMALPPQVEFSPSGNVLVVTERFADEEGHIVTYTVDHKGLLSEPIVHPPFGRTPFGMMFTNDGVLIVSEAFVATPGNPIPKAGAASSFHVKENGELEVISQSVPALGTATCWVQISDDDRFAFTTNTASDNITTFRIKHDGSLERLHLTPTGNKPIGMAMSADGRFLYNLNSISGTITAFRVDKNDGSLTQIQKIDVESEAAFGMMGH